MTLFFIMFTEYYTKNLNEYNKIIDVLYSCENTDHIECSQNMVEAFVENSNFRLEKLRKRAAKNFWNKLYRKEYKSYKDIVSYQLDDISTTIQAWVDGYKKSLQEESIPKRSIIFGFRKK